jgi:hypothetical protein
MRLEKERSVVGRGAEVEAGRRRISGARDSNALSNSAGAGGASIETGKCRSKPRTAVIWPSRSMSARAERFFRHQDGADRAALNERDVISDGRATPAWRNARAP